MEILLTGFSGFLGKHILKSCELANHNVWLLGRSDNAMIKWDFQEEAPFLPACKMVVHCAGLAHKKKIKDSQLFFLANYKATVNLCDALVNSKSLPKQFVFISTVAVYGLDSGKNIEENEMCMPTTPYGESKLEAEKFLLLWAKKYNVKLLIIRLPLVADFNSPGNLGAMIKAIKYGYYFRFGKGSARRSIVLASDVAHFIANLRDCEGIIHLTDGLHPSYAELDTAISSHFGKNVRSLSSNILRTIGKVGDILTFIPINTYRIEKFERSLTFSDSKARCNYQWNSSSVVEYFKS